MLKFKSSLVMGSIVLLSVAMFGCSSPGDVRSQDAGLTPTGIFSPGASASTASKTPQTRFIKDAKGEIEIPVHPQRIADLSGSTEELLVLGFQPIASGNTDMGNPKEFTPILKSKLKADTVNTGWFQTDINIETVISANPDLILVGPTQDKIYEQLQKVAPTVRVPFGFNAFRDRFVFVAEVLDKKKEMEKWLQGYDEQVKQLSEKITALTKQETYAVIEATSKEVRIYSSTGVADLIFNDMKLPKSSGTPEPDKWGGKVTSLEGLSTLNPDHLILMADSDQNVLEQSQVWSGLKAVKNGKIYRMTSKQNFNEAFFALGKISVMEQLGNEIVQKNK